jgi:polygalacturonase
MNAIRSIAVALGGLALLQPTAAQTLPQQAEPKDMNWYVVHAPFAMPAVAQPSIPRHDFPLTDYGANGDGQTLNTAAFQQAIKACAAAGGGRVVVPAGQWLTGPIELLSHVDLHLEKGAWVQFTRDHSQYPTIGNKAAIASPVYSINQQDIAITGEGTMDGAGETWRPVKKSKMTAAQWQTLLSQGGVLSPDGQIGWPSQEAKDQDAHRPYMVAFSNCHNILISGVTLRNSPKFVFYPSHCTDITLDHAHIFNEWWAQNGDGIDISACKRVIIYGCVVNAGDDGICMKSSGASTDHSPALEDVIVAGCTVYRAHGGFVIGSNTDGGVQDVFVSDCTFVGTDVGLRFKSNNGRGGLVHDIFIRDIAMKDIAREAVLFDTYYEDMPAGSSGKANHPADKTPEFRDFHLSQIRCTGAATAISITGLPQMPVSAISFDSVDIQAGKAVVAKEARDIRFHDVRINGVSYNKLDGD